MSFQVFGQRDPQWAGHALGSGAGEMGPYGCYEVSYTMVAYDAYDDMHYNPASFDDVLYADGVFQGDNLPDNALDRAFPDRFQSHVESGFNAANVNAAINSPDTYCIVCIHNPAVGVTGYHFMVMYGAGPNFLVADPWWGKVMTLATWGGPGVVVKTIFVKSLAAQRAAAAAQAQAQAMAVAKAAADAAAAQAAANAAAKAKLDADTAAVAAQAAAEAATKAAKDAADRAAAEAAVQAAAVQAARDAALAAAKAAAGTTSKTDATTVQPLVNPVKRGWFEALLIILRVLLQSSPKNG